MAKERKKPVTLSQDEARAVATFCTQTWNCTPGTQRLIESAYRKMRGEK